MDTNNSNKIDGVTSTNISKAFQIRKLLAAEKSFPSGMNMDFPFMGIALFPSVRYSITADNFANKPNFWRNGRMP